MLDRPSDSGRTDSSRNTEANVEQQNSTAVGAKGIFRRFVFVLIVFEILVGVGVLTYDVFDNRKSMHQSIEAIAALGTHVAQTLRADYPDATDQDILLQASQLTKCPMGLVTKQGTLTYTTHPAMNTMVERAYGDRVKVPSQRYPIRKDFGEVSGGWFARPLSDSHDMLMIVPHIPDSEGAIMYVSISAGVIAVALTTSVLAMLGAANWMLHRPLARLVRALTSALKRDVERRRTAEHTAVQARLDAEAHLAFLNNLIDASDHLGVVATDTNDIIQLLNRTAESILGFTSAEAVGKITLTNLMSQSRRRSTHEAPLRSLMKLQDGEVFVTDRSGTEHLVSVNFSDIGDADGQVKGRLMVFIDMTERRRLEVELQLNEMQLVQSSRLAGLGEMASGVAHELNQPLNNISLLASRVMRKLTQSEEPHEFESEKLEKIQTQVQRAGQIIDQLRTFGRPTVARVKRFPVRRPVESVLDLYQDQLTRQDIEIVVDIPEGLPEVCADEPRLEQVLINLLNNARDSFDSTGTCSDPPRIRVKAETEIVQGDDPPRVYLHVEDNGSGMSEDVCRQVFRPFFTTKEVGKGTGLGLSISYSLVRGFGGTLAFNSRLGEGTTFSILLRTTMPPELDSEDAPA